MLLAVLAFAVATAVGAGSWAGWLGWDHTMYRVSPEYAGDDGLRGPYREWQVVGCAVTMGVTGVLLSWWLSWRWSWVAVAAGLSVGFCGMWIRDLLSDLEAAGPLWAVGTAFCVVGVSSGSLAVTGVTSGVRSRRRERDRVG